MGIYRIDGGTLYKAASIIKAAWKYSDNEVGANSSAFITIDGKTDIFGAGIGYHTNKATKNGFDQLYCFMPLGECVREAAPVRLYGGVADLHEIGRALRGERTVNIEIADGRVTFSGEKGTVREWRVRSNAPEPARDMRSPFRLPDKPEWTLSGMASGWKLALKAMNAHYSREFMRKWPESAFKNARFRIHDDIAEFDVTDRIRVFHGVMHRFARDEYGIIPRGEGEQLLSMRGLKIVLSGLTARDKVSFSPAEGYNQAVVASVDTGGVLVRLDMASQRCVYPAIERTVNCDFQAETKYSFVADVHELIGAFESVGGGDFVAMRVSPDGVRVFGSEGDSVMVRSDERKTDTEMTFGFNRKYVVEQLKAVAAVAGRKDSWVLVRYHDNVRKPVSFSPIRVNYHTYDNVSVLMPAALVRDFAEREFDTIETEPEPVDATAETVAAAETVAETAEPVEPATVEAEPVAEDEAAAVAESEAEAVAVDAAPVAETPVAEPEPETVEIPEVPPQTDDKARVVKVSADVMPAGVSAREFEGFNGFAHKARGFKNEAGRRIVYVAFDEGRCVVAYREGYRHGMCPEADTAVAEYLKRFGWTLTA